MPDPDDNHRYVYEYEAIDVGPATAFALRKVTSPEGVIQHYQHDNDSNRTAYWWEGLSNHWTWTYDDRGNLRFWTNPLADTEEWQYDSLNNVIHCEDAAGVRTEFKYESPVDPTALTEIVLPPPEAGGQTGHILLDYHPRYSGKGLLKSVTDANGVVTEYEYDGYGQLNRETERTDNGTSPRVGVKHKFDPMGRHIGSKVLPLGPSAAPPGGDVSSDNLTGRNTWDTMDRLPSSGMSVRRSTS